MSPTNTMAKPAPHAAATTGFPITNPKKNKGIAPTARVILPRGEAVWGACKKSVGATPALFWRITTPCMRTSARTKAQAPWRAGWNGSAACRDHPPAADGNIVTANRNGRLCHRKARTWSTSLAGLSATQAAYHRYSPRRTSPGISTVWAPAARGTRLSSGCGPVPSRLAPLDETVFPQCADSFLNCRLRIWDLGRLCPAVVGAPA